MPAVPAAQVGHRLAGLDLRQLERGVHVLLREAPGGYPSSRFQEDAIGLAHARRSAPAGGSTHSSAHRSSPRTTRPRASPLRVRRYSTPTGGPERTRRSTTPASSSSLRRSDSMRSLTTCKRSSVKRAASEAAFLAVGAPDLAEDVGDLAERAVGLHGVEHRDHEVF